MTTTQSDVDRRLDELGEDLAGLRSSVKAIHAEIQQGFKHVIERLDRVEKRQVRAEELADARAAQINQNMNNIVTAIQRHASDGHA